MTLSAHSFAQIPADPIAEGFHNVPNTARLRMFWRVFGPAWTRSEIDYQFSELKKAGVGGVMTCFTYPVALNDPANGIVNQNFLAPEFLDTLKYAAQKAREVGLEFGVCGGTGWPFGGPTVRLNDAAQRLRMESLTPQADGKGYVMPTLREGEHGIAAFLGTRDVTASLHGDLLELPVTGEACRVFIAGPTFMHVKRAALGGEGYVVNHFEKGAVLRYLDAVVAPILKAAPDGLLSTLFCDSLEVYNANWTHDLPAQFQHRRGYDLVPYLPQLFDATAAHSKDLRFDFWRTLAELTEDEFARPVQAWCKKHGIAFALEAYGTPSMGFTGARWCDVPWGEQYEWKGFSFARFASSGGHLNGKKVIGAEAWTWAGIPNRLADSLADLKLCSDLHFLSGANELTGVDYPYSPRVAGTPGWTPYYGPVLNQNNPQWALFPSLADYASRCQWLLRQGEPVADIALYTPTEDVFADGLPDQMLLDFRLRDRLVTGTPTDEFGLQKALQHHSDVIATLLRGGYNFDGIDFFAMNALARVEGEMLHAGDGRYSILILPNITGMDLSAARKIAKFCRAGGTVIATRRLPDRVYGLHTGEANSALQSLMARMFGLKRYSAVLGPGTTMLSNQFGKGRALFVADENNLLTLALMQSRQSPDARLTPPQPDVAHVHRRVGAQDFYFVCNVGETKASFTADFRVTGKSASLWNPLDGTITPVPLAGTEKGRTQVALTLPPRGSIFVCFTPGETQSAPFPSPTPLTEIPLTLDWHVTFEGPDAPAPVETRELTSWTAWPGAKFFSGHATYRTTLNLPASLPTRALLRFSQVREAAAVIVNGHQAGAIWLPPLELDVTPFLKPGANTLEIMVANLPVNRVLGLPDPDLGPLRAAYGARFPAPEEKRLLSEPLPSGLIGPIFLCTPAR